MDCFYRKKKMKKNKTSLFCHSEQGSETTAVETSQKILVDELELKDRYKLRQIGRKNSYFMILF